MIDRQNRDNLSHRLRLLATGQITNDEFEDSIHIKSEDPAIWRIFRNGAWPLYDDLHEHKLTGKYRLPNEEKKNIARTILFLKSDREYEWKEPAWFIKAALILFGLPTFGFVPRLFYRKFFSGQGDSEVWPYIRKSDLEADLDKQPYLNANENR